MVSSAPKGLPAETAGTLARVTPVFVTRAEASAPRGPLPVWTWSLRASPRMVGGTRVPSQRQGWRSGPSPVKPCDVRQWTSPPESQFPHLNGGGGRGMTSPSQVAMGRLLGVRGAGRSRHGAAPSLTRDSPCPLSQGGCRAQPGWGRKLSLPWWWQLVRPVSAHFGWGGPSWQLCGGISWRGEEPLLVPERRPRGLWLARISRYPWACWCGPCSERQEG